MKWRKLCLTKTKHCYNIQETISLHDISVIWLDNHTKLMLFTDITYPIPRHLYLCYIIFTQSVICWRMMHGEGIYVSRVEDGEGKIRNNKEFLWECNRCTMLRVNQSYRMISRRNINRRKLMNLPDETMTLQNYD